MQEFDINTLIDINNILIDNNNILTKYIPNDIIIGKINNLCIKYKYNQLDLSRLECNILYYYDQEGESIKNHILPNSLKELYCFENKLTSLPNLPNSLRILHCHNNKLTSLPNLPNSLQNLLCQNNKLI